MSFERDGFLLPQCFDDKFARRVLDLEVYDSDVWVITVPKSGTTWTQEMVWMVANDCNYEKAKRSIDERFPELDLSSVFDFHALKEKANLDLPELMLDSISYVKNMPAPRFIKSHLPWKFLPRQIQDGSKKPKIIYVVRNPKDVCVSFYHHQTNISLNDKPFETFCEQFLNGELIYSPYWDNVSSHWEHRHAANYLFLNYEDMIGDLPKVLRRVAKFLNKYLTDEDVEKLNEHLSFKNMKKNKYVNKENMGAKLGETLIKNKANFMRSGIAGDHKNIMSNEMNKKFDVWFENNVGDKKVLYSIK